MLSLDLFPTSLSLFSFFAGHCEKAGIDRPFFSNREEHDQFIPCFFLLLPPARIQEGPDHLPPFFSRGCCRSRNREGSVSFFRKPSPLSEEDEEENVSPPYGRKMLSAVPLFVFLFFFFFPTAADKRRVSFLLAPIVVRQNILSFDVFFPAEDREGVVLLLFPSACVSTHEAIFLPEFFSFFPC